ncbi:hypothetical protein [Morganella morganii IS15]|nr:hypothetical protein [Morganella morganii IS15]
MSGKYHAFLSGEFPAPVYSQIKVKSTLPSALPSVTKSLL